MSSNPLTPDDLSAIRVLYEQLHACRAQVEAFIPHHADGSGVSVVIPKFNKLLERTQHLLRPHTALRDAIELVDPVHEIEERLVPSYHQKAKQELLFGCNMLLQALAPLVLAAAPGTISMDREGVFFAGQHFDALQAASKILRQASQSIVLVDGYINHDVLSLLASKQSGVTVRVLTKPTLPADIKPLAEAFNKQHGVGSLQIRTTNAFHDRFIIVDDSDYYHFGASLKDLGGRGFMFSRIEETIIVSSLKRQVNDEWLRGTVIA